MTSYRLLPKYRIIVSPIKFKSNSIPPEMYFQIYNKAKTVRIKDQANP